MPADIRSRDGGSPVEYAWTFTRLLTRAAGLALVLVFAARSVAQQPPPAAEKAAPAISAAEGKTSPPAAEAKPAGALGDPKNDAVRERKQGEVGAGEQLGFRQSKVAAEMSELEERMFRLAEALKALELENACGRQPWSRGEFGA